MDGLSITASIAAIIQITGSVITYLDDVKDATSECEEYQIEASSLNTQLLKLKKLVKTADAGSPWFEELRDLEKPLDQYRAALQSLQEKITHSGKLRKVRNVLFWTSVKDDVARILNRIGRIQNLVFIALAQDHFALSKATKFEVSTIRDDVFTIRTKDVPAIQSGIAQIETEYNRHKHQQIVQWITEHDFASQYHDIISRREKNTGQWFTASAEFQAWQQGNSSQVLYCHGIPGAGKTMCTAIAIEFLRERALREDVGLAHVFCVYKSRNEQTLHALLSDILKQLVQGRTTTPDPVKQLYEKHRVHKTRASIDELAETIRQVCMSYSVAYIIVDALDECTDIDRVKQLFIQQLLSIKATTNTRLMFTSRPLPDVADIFQSESSFEVRADIDDVKKFVSGQLPRLARCVQKSTELQIEIRDKIAEVVDGMFLLARLHVDSLLDKRTTLAVKTSLQNLKTGGQTLEKAYHEAIHRIDCQLPDDAYLAIQEDIHELTADAILDIEDVLCVCAGLVVVDKSSNVVRFVHYTTQDYLEKIRTEWSPGSQRDIAVACLTYLSMDILQHGICESYPQLQQRRKNHVFLDYAAQNWGLHTEPVQKDVVDLALRFLSSNALVSAAGQIVLQNAEEGWFTTGLHEAASHGQTHLFQCLLDTFKSKSHPSDLPDAPILMSKNFETLSVDARNFWGETPLMNAAHAKRLLMVEFLVQNYDIDVNIQDADGRTAIWHAMGLQLYAGLSGGHEAMVQALLEHKQIQPDIPDNFGRIPLMQAARSGHKGIFDLLHMRCPSSLQSQDKGGSTVLHWAARGNNTAIVEKIMNCDGVEVNAKDKVFNETPLLAAASVGHEAIVLVLLGRADIDVHSKGSSERTLLSYAASRGHIATLRLLLERKDVDMDSRDGIGRTPLIYAIENCHQDCVQVLLAQDGILADAKDDKGQTPLLYAARQGNVQLVGLLTEREDANLNSKDNNGGTPLSWAIRWMNVPVVHHLLGLEGIDAATVDDSGRTPHMLAQELSEWNENMGEITKALDLALTRPKEDSSRHVS